MTKFKINRNKPDPDDAQISRHKDFGKLLQNHQKVSRYKDATRPLYKNRGFMSFIVVLGVVLLTYIISEREQPQSQEQPVTDSIQVSEKTEGHDHDNSTGQKTNTTEDPAFTPPPAAEKTIATRLVYVKPEIAFASFKVDPEKGGIVYHNSTRIIIPPLAFKDASGRVIHDEVELRYREFRDPADMYLAEIPMHYDSAGIKYNLESAGMFELLGFSGREPVFLESPLTVELALPDHSAKFNTYHMNADKSKWEYTGKEIQTMRFMIQANEKEYPELNPFRNMVWELVVDDQQKDQAHFKTCFSKTWGSLAISENAAKSTNNVKARQNSTEVKFFARLVPVLNDTAANNRLMKAKFEEYHALVRKQLKAAAGLKEAQRKQEMWLNSPEGKKYLEWTRSKEGQKQILSGNVVTLFAVDRFGIWNSDRPLPLPDGTASVPAYTGPDGRILDLDKIYLVDYSINTLFTYSAREPLRYSHKSPNVLWAALPEGRMAVFHKEKFKSLAQVNGKYTISMDVIDVNGKSVQEIKTILGMNAHSVHQTEEKAQSPAASNQRFFRLKKPVRVNDVLYQKDSSAIKKNSWRMN